MANENRSLWEIYHSETEPWCKGRTILLSIAFFYFVVQITGFAAAVLSGNIERALGFTVIAMLFWLLLYLIWIGLHWVRLVWGGWNMISGFGLLIWGWRDSSGYETTLGAITLLIGTYLCLSPSVYSFARRQRETVRWQEAVLIAVVCLLVIISIAAALLGLQFVHIQREREAARFAEEVAQRVYLDHDFDWTLAHVTPTSLEDDGRERLRYFFSAVRRQLGEIRSISGAQATVSLRFRLPSTFASDAQVISNAESAAGPVELHARLLEEGSGWEVDRMWWTFAPMPENPLYRR